MTNDEIEAVAAVLYGTHWRPPAPPWENVSAHARLWVRQQAVTVLAMLEKRGWSGRNLGTFIIDNGRSYFIPPCDVQ